MSLRLLFRDFIILQVLEQFHIFMCYAADRKSAYKAYLLGIGVPVFFYVITTVICIMSFGCTSPKGYCLSNAESLKVNRI